MPLTFQLLRSLCLLGIVSLISYTNVSYATENNSTFKVQKRFLYVQPGQSISRIVSVLYPDYKKMWPKIIKKIVRVNPRAFVNRDPRKIIEGERILLPVIKSKVKHVKSNMVFKQREAVGKVIKSRGKAFVISRKKIKHTLKIGSEVHVGDSLYTGKDGFVRLSMIDDAKIDLRCNSEIKIEDYQLLRAGNRSIIHLIKGSLRKITGSIGKMANDVYKMKTPMATIGVRGTDYALRVLQSYGCDGSIDVNSKGLFVKVNKGAVDINNSTGKHGLTKGNAVYLKNKNKKPEYLKQENGIFDAKKDTISPVLMLILGVLILGVVL